MQRPSTSSALTELPRLVRVLNRWLDGIAFVFKVAISACLAVMVVLNLYNVISRSVFGVAYGWIFSWTMLIFAWMLLLGLYVFIRHRRDVVVDIFMARLPAMLRRVAGLFSCLVGMAVMLAILRGAPALLQLQTAMMDTIDLPIYMRSLPLFIAAGLILLHFTLDFICIASGWVEAFPRQDDAVEKGAIE